LGPTEYVIEPGPGCRKLSRVTAKNIGEVCASINAAAQNGGGQYFAAKGPGVGRNANIIGPWRSIAGGVEEPVTKVKKISLP